jgi:hypothetical protein
MLKYEKKRMYFNLFHGQGGMDMLIWERMGVQRWNFTDVK